MDHPGSSAPTLPMPPAKGLMRVLLHTPIICRGRRPGYKRAQEVERRMDSQLARHAGNPRSLLHDRAGEHETNANLTEALFRELRTGR